MRWFTGILVERSQSVLGRRQNGMIMRGGRTLPAQGGVWGVYPPSGLYLWRDPAVFFRWAEGGAVGATEQPATCKPDAPGGV